MKLKELLNHVWMSNNIIIEEIKNRDKKELARIEGKNNMGIVEGWKFDNILLSHGEYKVLNFGCRDNNIEILISLNEIKE